MDDDTTVETFKFLNYCQLATSSLVSKRFWDLIRAHRRKLALLNVDSIYMIPALRNIDKWFNDCYVTNQHPTFIKIFNEELSPEEYNEWIIHNGYWEQSPLDGQIAGKEGTENGRNIYVLRANVRQNPNNSHNIARTVFHANVALKDETYFNTLFQHFLLMDPFIYICSLSFFSLKVVLSFLARAMNSDRNQLEYLNNGHNITTTVFHACAELKDENWPLFQHFVRLLMDPFIYIRSLELNSQKDVLSLLAGALNQDRRRLQYHVRCDKLEIHGYNGLNYDEELLDLYLTGAPCTSSICVEYCRLSKATVHLVQKFMCLKKHDQYLMVESIRGDIKGRRFVEELKRNCAEFIAEEKQYGHGHYTTKVIGFINNDIKKKLTLCFKDFTYGSSPFSIKITNV